MTTITPITNLRESIITMDSDMDENTMECPMECVEMSQLETGIQSEKKNIFEGCLKTHFEQNAFTRLQRLMVSHPNYCDAFKSYNKRFLTSIPNGVELSQIKTIFKYKAMSYSFQLVSDLARCPQDDRIFMEIFDILFYHALTSINETANFALVEMENLAKSRHLSLEGFYKLNSRPIIKCLTEAIIYLMDGGQREVNVQSSIIIALEVFNQDSITLEVISQSLSHVAELVGKDEHLNAARMFIMNLAASLDMEPVNLINRHIQAILINLLADRRLQTTDVKKALDFLATISGAREGAGLRELLSTKSTFIKSRILLDYSTNDLQSKKTVTDAIYFLDTLFVDPDADDGPMLEELEDERHLIEYLRPSFIGILLGIDSHFLSVKNELGNTDTIRQIESLSYIIQFFHPSEIEVIHVKLMSTLSLLIRLRPSRNNSRLNRTICGIWYNFVKKMPPEVLASLIINICVTLYDLIDDCPKDVSTIYSFMLREENVKILDGMLKSLFFLPDVPDLRETYSFLTKFIKRDVHSTTNDELADLIDTVIPLLKQENQRCRVLALTRMREIIKKNIGLLHKIIFKHRDEPIDKLISRIIENLLTLSSYQDRETSSLIAECLGAIGAIDPIRLDHLIFGETPTAHPTILHIVSSLEEDIFIIELIERLKNSLFSDEKDESESASYALQVVVKNFNLYNSRNQIRLTTLSTEAIRACDLCRNTAFGATMSTPSINTVTIYEKLKSEHIYSYKVWLHKFTLNLINSFSDQHAKIREVLCACSYVSKYNHLLAQFILPYTMAHIILNEHSKLNTLQDEITIIMDEDTGLSTQDMDSATTEDGGNLQSLHFQCANMIFSAMDFIFKMYAHRMAQKMSSDPTTKALSNFLQNVSHERLAILAYRCKSYARALCYFEQHLFATGNLGYDKYATIMQRIYVALDDAYEARGIDMKRTRSPTVLDDISEHEATGHYDRAFINCSIAMQSNLCVDQHNYQRDALRCLSLQGDFDRLNEISKDYLDKYPILKQDLMPYFIESSWKLNKWDELDTTVKTENIEPMLDSIGVGLGALINTVMNSRPVKDTIDLVRHRQMKPLSLALIDKSAYFRGYQSLLSFHMINDLESCINLMMANQQFCPGSNMIQNGNIAQELTQNLFSEWQLRNELTQPSLKSLEPILTLQRSLADMIKTRFMTLGREIKSKIGFLWLHSAKLSREARSFERAHLCITQAQRFLTDAGFERLSLEQRSQMLLEKTKLHWDRNDKTSAIRGLKLALGRLKDHPLSRHLSRRTSQRIADAPLFPILGEEIQCKDCEQINAGDKKAFAKIKLLLTYYCEESAAAMPGTLFDMYEELVHLAVDQEETYFRLARYYDRLLTYYIENPHLVVDSAKHDQYESGGRLSQSIVGDKEDVYTRLMVQSIYAFGNSLLFGVRYLRESMPRLLNIWYDLGSKKANNEHSRRATSSRIEESIRFLGRLQEKLPPYYFMTAISLVLSRICHGHSGVAKKTISIIVELLQFYPNQLTWRLITVLNDKENPERMRAANNLFKQVKAVKQKKIIEDTISLASVLIEVCSKSLPKTFKPGCYAFNLFVPNYEQLAHKGLQVLVPTQAALTAVIPLDNSATKKREESFEPYPSYNQTFFKKFRTQVDVMSSMQKPRKLTLLCSDGANRSLLCKPVDDLRKDSRCMEFFDLINKLLKRDANSNARFFEIQTFLVLPLNSSSGVLEWLPNLAPLRGLIEGLYKERNPKFSISDIYGRRQNPPNDVKIQLYINEVLPRVKPGPLPMWFLRNFCEPTSWYMARLAYTRTTAVISMAGYIIGLGDRHLDNILIDTKTGKTVHVDFNLLFHQGELLPVSERVPFRLTHNLVSTFGALGYEGNFRSASEITMRVMRKEKDALLTTLKPFIHDPCSDWIRIIEGRRTEMENTTAKEKIIDTERKLKGYPRSKFKPLSLIDSYSVEAQVDNLIEEAIDPQNLSLMFPGWCPHI